MYLTLAEADAYFNTHLQRDTWFSYLPEERSRALAEATRIIDSLPYAGRVAVPGQPHAFPRAFPASFLLPPSEQSFDHLLYGLRPYYVQPAVPQRVLDAVCEVALHLLASQNDSRRKLQEAGVTRFSLGELSEEYGPVGLKQLLGSAAYRLLQPYLAGSVACV
ncbi:hypothetical protein Desku_1116 [Desulfofundulus kuznetsovii DSM 6115]|uniref:Uncharacterized protein n=1 Tax=Desulfofundulus kuznetsovii (strain DSM 6115 / VKM B-1805 / 17) TaxID=760568 RepID=A0AAU8P9R0_DESK7|nr:hypothetical protein Desku_1116 [Desulfofundulus kuznetsovii DSM 6115]